MMNMKWLSILIVGFIIFTFNPAAAGAGQMPVGSSCPAGFESEPHVFENHEMHEHHIGLKVDLNGDGLICVKHLKNGLHVHADNVIR